MKKHNQAAGAAQSIVTFLPVRLSAIIILFLLMMNARVPAQGFKASVVKIDITPGTPQMLLGYQARKSTGVHDKIYHRIVAMDDGRSQFFIISTDICLISPSQYDKLAERLQKEFKIDPMQVWWSATHTHSAPEVGPPGLPAVFLGERYKHDFDVPYTNLVEQRIVDGIAEARRKLAPARIAAGWGHSNANINRRAREVDGKTSLGMNPDGPVDRAIGLLRLERTDGSLMALIANYAIHGTVMSGQNLEISGDAPGVVSEYVEQKTGAPLLFINGAAGNIAPIYSVYPNPQAGRLNQFKAMLGEKIIDANKTIAAGTAEVTLRFGGITVETPRKKDLGWPADLEKYTRTTKTGENLVKLPVRFLKINEDIAIWSAPLELFCEISNDVRSQSPFPYTFYFGYTNGWLGYLLAEDEIKYGGYETTVSPYAPGAAKNLTDAVVNHLHGWLRSAK
ncbi:neutral/alkaline non-lysosomal ceramidase N-terminal domain-containing protein [Dyadobacter sp. 676]|uniref:Neutral ceramidase n=1 Tax=Dyadobacter sp. 676 TaxID=3088362 RepID=A0AAU8FLZ9_9BACT